MRAVCVRARARVCLCACVSDRRGLAVRHELDVCNINSTTVQHGTNAPVPHRQPGAAFGTVREQSQTTPAPAALKPSHRVRSEELPARQLTDPPSGG
jgi:hypothetical protein